MSELKRIVKLSELLILQKNKVDELKEALKEAEKNYRRIEREDLPCLMAEANLTKIELTDGSIVEIKEDLDARITEATKPMAIEWLLTNKFGGIIKTNVNVSFGRGDHETANAVYEELVEHYPGVELKEDVHPQTLKAFVKEQMASGQTVPMDIFNVYPYAKAIIKKGK